VSAPAPRDVLGRPTTAGPDGGGLSAWDDYPVHQRADVLSAIEPQAPGWAERFYFNALRPGGEIVMIVGGGVYPARGLAECYFCRLEGDRQVNVRTSQPLPAVDGGLPDGPFTLRCETPLNDWSVAVELPGERFAGRFSGSLPPHLYRTIDVPASEPGGPYDLFRHFIALGRWQLDEDAGLAGGEELIGVRDRTWGIRTRRPRLHLWSVLQVGEGCLSFKHQELADGSVMFSEAALTGPGSEVTALDIAEHDLVFDPHQRQIVRGRLAFAGEGGPRTLEFERVGTGMRLSGAGYDDSQGDRGATSGVQRDEYDLSDPVVAARTGRGTIDAGVRARLEGTGGGDGIGVVETAIARDHVRYGADVTPG
jgi:hypothetical protein